MQRTLGFSPFQLVFGKHHLALNRELNYQNCEQSNRLMKFENLIAKARQQFLIAENSERIKSALTNKQLLAKYDTFQPQDIVSYFRNGTKAETARKGPAKVIGIDGNTVIIKHGQSTVHAHKRDVRKFLKDDNAESSWRQMGNNIEKLMMRNEAENYKEQDLISGNETDRKHRKR